MSASVKPATDLVDWPARAGVVETLQPTAAPAVAAADVGAPIIIVGTGPIGIRTARELLERTDGRAVLLFGDEPWVPYNRVVLSCYLAGETDDIGLEVPDDPRLTPYYGLRITAIDRAACTVTDSTGGVHAWHRLILATGSRPRVPSIPGVDLAGVYTFRDLADADRLKARTARSRAVTVLGGGILGLETARALRRADTRVRVLDHNDHLMFNQLDSDAGRRLGAFVASLGIEVLTGDAVQQIIGVSRVSGVLLRSGALLDCDTVVIAAGIVPNVNLAREAGLGVGRGVRVDDGMRTNDPRIFAVGECAEHRGIVYGLVAPGLEQAAIAAHNVAADLQAVDATVDLATKPSVDLAPMDGDAHYLGSVSAARLKVVGCAVFSIGDVQESEIPRPSVTFHSDADGICRKLWLQHGRLVGAIAVGPWHETNRLQEAVISKRRLRPWTLSRFRASGLLWSEPEDQSIFDWPASAAVCNCTGVKLVQLQTALAAGATSEALLTSRTGAGSVCGSCRPLLAELAGADAPDPVANWRSLGLFSLLSTLIAALIFILPGVPFNASVADPLRWDVLWRDGLAKQITGFTLLGLAGLVSVLGLRKRLPRFTLGSFDLWRLLHVVLGVLAVAVLLAHTGLRLGHNLNLWLMLSFTGLLLAGGIGGAIIAVGHRLPRKLVRRGRNGALWAHLLLVWPLPVLLGFHVLKGYWY